LYIKPEKFAQDHLYELARARSKIKDVLETSKSSLTKARCSFLNLIDIFLKNPRRQVIPCGAGRIRYYMNARGEVFPCVVWGQMIGSLRNVSYDFKSIFSSPQRLRARRMVEQNQCPICFLTCELIPSMMAHPLHTAWKLLRARSLMW